MPSLECYVAAKQTFLTEHGQLEDESFLSLYDYQQKYVKGLTRQLPPVTNTSRNVTLHHPGTVKNRALRQGPFLLQPAPTELHDGLDSEATDICYVTLSSGAAEDDDDLLESLKAERLGAILVAFQDGRVDICLDLDKVEAKWDLKQVGMDLSMCAESSHEFSKVGPESLPVLTVFETIDLAFPTTAEGGMTNVLDHSYPILRLDPIHDDTLYVYHPFGVHLVDLGQVVRSIIPTFKEDIELSMDFDGSEVGCSVSQILDTFSMERRYSFRMVIPFARIYTYLEQQRR